MAQHRDDDIARPEEAVSGEAATEDTAVGSGDPAPDRPDPLGLGVTPPPDAPSRRSKPQIIALLGEFLAMSRTTAVLLGTFVLAGVLYLLVREEPVVAFGPPAPPTSSAPAEPVDPSVTPTPTQTTVPTPTTAADPTATDTRTPGTTAPEGSATTSTRPGGQPGGAGQPAPQEQSAPQQQTQQPQPQPDQQSQPQSGQEAPGGGEATAPGGGVLEG